MKPVNVKKRLKSRLENWIHASPSLHKILHLLQPDIWHFNRRSVSGAVWIGIFSAFIPVPAQAPIAIWLSLMCRVNLPIAIAGTFISNPVTMAPILFANYKLGAWLTGMNNQAPNSSLSIEALWDLIVTSFQSWSFSGLWQGASNAVLPLLIGSLSTGFVLASFAYILVRLIWRGYVVYLWQRRQARMLNSTKKSN